MKFLPSIVAALLSSFFSYLFKAQGVEPIILYFVILSNLKIEFSKND